MHADASTGHMAFFVQIGRQRFENNPNAHTIIDSTFEFLTPLSSS